jgi:hypothetical protein
MIFRINRLQDFLVFTGFNYLRFVDRNLVLFLYIRATGIVSNCCDFLLRVLGIIKTKKRQFSQRISKGSLKPYNVQVSLKVPRVGFLEELVPRHRLFPKP